MIKSFRNKDTERVFKGVYIKGLSKDIQISARRRLVYLHAARTLKDLKNNPGNRLEKLKGDREDQYSIRINDQYRICFDWLDGNAYQVEITDYH
jgi:proteic killer suppression protein